MEGQIVSANDTNFEQKLEELIAIGSINDLQIAIVRLGHVIANLNANSTSKSAIIKNLPGRNHGYAWQRELLMNIMKPIHAKNIMIRPNTNLAEITFYTELDRESAKDILSRASFQLIY